MDKARIMLIAIGAASALVGVVLVPVLLHKSEPAPRFNGPSLAEITHREVTFPSGGLQLGGILVEPDGPGPFPVVVVIHGSGTSRRDNSWYLSFAASLRDNGIAVMLPDKRGSEQSEGDWRSASFDDLAADTEAAIAFLREDGGYRDAPLGLMGMSQGGWIAPIVATTSQVSFVVSISGSAVRPPEQLRHEEGNTLRDMGFLAPVAKVIAPVSAWSIRAVRQRQFWRQIEGFDPIPFWQRVKVPTFVAYGELDELDNVPVEESVRRLTAVGEETGAPITVKVYPDGGHAIEDPATNTLHPALRADLVQFINGAVSR